MNKNVKSFLSVCIFTLNLIITPHAFGYSGGVTGYSGNPATNAGKTCSTCHIGGSVPTVNLSGPTTVQLGSISRYTLTVTDGQQNSGGLDISVDGGSLISTLTDTVLQNNEITHTQRITAANDGSLSWSFEWQAPSTSGIYTLYSAGLSTNGDSNTTLDNVSTNAFTVSVSSDAPQSPTAVIKAPVSAQLNTVVNFNGSSSFDSDGTIGDYSWDFGDGNTATEVQATNTYVTAGTYTTTLTVTDNDNLTNSTFQDITVGGVMVPIANLGGSYTGIVGQAVNFDASQSSHIEAITKYVWDFGDGSAVVQDAIATTSHTFNQTGAYTVTLAVQDAKIITGVANTTVVIDAVAAPPPTIDGASLYANYCASCHGVLASSTKINKTTTQIQAAVDANTGGMAGLNSLTSEQVQAIADVLVTAVPPPAADGATLYANNCSNCHNALASSTKLNKTASQIQAAIDANTGGMEGLNSLTPTEVQSIADALVTVTPPPPPTDGPTLYTNNCAACHGALATSSKLNRTITQIQAAIDANTGGMGGLNSLTTTEVQAIADALVNLTPPPPPTDGQSLYANNCETCHGSLATSSKLNRNASEIQAAIDANTGGMGGLNTLTPTDVQAIADALVSVTPPPEPTTGEALYESYCLVCHGIGGTGGQYKAVTGASNSEIADSITQETLMNSISLTTNQIQDIADYLSGSIPPSPPVTGENLYITYCLACHGSGGKGGLYEDITGESASEITSAIDQEPLMNSLSLNSSQIDDIADYLSGSNNNPAPAPTDGVTLYANYCAGCHNVLTNSSKLDRTANQIQTAINANSGGMSALTSLTPTNIQAIADALSTGNSPPPTPTDGATLYSNNCSSCHGNLASSSKLNRSANQIQAAIDANTGGMAALSSLLPTQVQAVADALTGGGSTPTPTNGEQRYIALCQSCHGFNGTGGSAKAIVGVGASQITGAVSSIGAMQSIVLSGTDAQDIADFLIAGGGTQPTPTTGEDIYAIKCASCHGPDGNGGSEEKIVGASLKEIQEAMLEVSDMQPIPLTNGEAQALENYLSGDTEADDD